ncbi:DNA repair protein RecN [Geobacter sp. FeAm09]|uniref:DNA repair protein RecN n=1 Tax=Geobacter sp. FeAm09 TaxID=2597769 RepID=UPI0011EC92E1|nr:DNA repair protein RecN [Geobacter sp. FeAm09]QEM67980.1 DNA repair protein RecN [Geobacter sp. FeAm09]
MLTDLTIKNIAIIDTLHISFREGLTVLTGETGAGKSIIIDAVGLIMGGRASADLIRSGADEAVVEALFDISAQPEVAQRLRDSGFDCDNDELLVKRSISRAGKNRVFINTNMATLALLADIAPRLINIYGQHESQTLLRPENHLRLLDAYAGLNPQREEYARAFERFRALQERLATLDEEEREAERRLDLLSYQSDEIARAELRAGEEEELEERRRLLAGAEKLGGTTASAFERLYEGDGAILGQLRRIKDSIAEVSAIDRSLEGVAASLENAYLQVEDAAIMLRDYASRIEADPTALQQADDRLDLIHRLKRKYAPTVEAILEFKQGLDGEIDALKGREQARHDLEEERERLARDVQQRGKELTARRTAAAGALSKALAAEVHQLAMKNAVVETLLEPLAEPRATGYERVELLFSPNPGEPPRPLARVASGGELSRLMLAFKQVLPEGDVPTLIFDEVDTGIGGATSEMVGQKLRKVASVQQVLCITHLAQVAVFAAQHLRVEKQVANGRTTTRVMPLADDERTREVARMLAGAKITDSALAHAAEMLVATNTL